MSLDSVGTFGIFTLYIFLGSCEPCLMIGSCSLKCFHPHFQLNDGFVTVFLNDRDPRV